MSLENKYQPQNTAWVTKAVTAPNQYPKDGDEVLEKDRKAHVDPYKETAEFPFEKDEVVWIVKPEYPAPLANFRAPLGEFRAPRGEFRAPRGEFRAPRGEFRITKAHPNDRYELVRCSDNTLHPELVEGKHLRRNI